MSGKKKMITKPILTSMIAKYDKLAMELGDEGPPRICTKMVDVTLELNDWLAELHPQATWPKSHGNVEVRKCVPRAT